MRSSQAITTRLRIPVLALLVGFLVECAGAAPGLETTRTVVNGQVFEILTADALFDNYFQQAGRAADIAAASKSLLLDPLARQMLDEKAQAPFMFATVALPYEPNAFLRRERQLLSSADAVAAIQVALPALAKALPGPATKIAVLPASPVMKPYLDKYGISGYGATLGSGRIVMAVDPTKPDWKAFLRYAAAHEYHHSTWIARHWVSADLTLLEYLVFEGRADAFARRMNPTFEVPADRYLTTDQEAAVWRQITPVLSERSSGRINEVMNGTASIPFGSGYAIGYHIVQAFLRSHPSSTDATLIDMEPGAILRDSGYGAEHPLAGDGGPRDDRPPHR
jgi:uncharacterized protein YjaZ